MAEGLARKQRERERTRKGMARTSHSPQGHDPITPRLTQSWALLISSAPSEPVTLTSAVTMRREEQDVQSGLDETEGFSKGRKAGGQL